MNRVQNRGFTLIELIFVLVILAIIMSIIVATYPGLTHSIKVRTDRASAKNIANAVRSWYVDNNTDPILQPDLRELLKAPGGIKTKTVTLQEVTNLQNYMDPVKTKPVSLLNANKVKEPNQNFFVGVIESGLDIRIVVSIGVGNEGIDISEISPETASESIATYSGYESGIIYVEPKL